VTNHAQAERRALADLLAAVGPDAPTRCAGWTTRDLAAHLVLRDRRLDAAPGIVLAPLAGRAERVRGRLAGGDYAELVALVRSGPPPWNPLALPALDRVANTVEFFVHHEDVRRGRPGWPPRDLAPDLSAALWASLRASAGALLRRAPVRAVLATPDGQRVSGGRGGPDVTVRGLPGELLLVAFGRRAAADVTIEGAADALLAAPQGI